MEEIKLTWEDMQKIAYLIDEVQNEDNFNSLREKYEDVLQRFIGTTNYIRKDWVTKELHSALEDAKDVFDAVRRIGVLIDKVNEL